MPTETNPLADVRDVSFTRHALFRMKEGGMSEYDVFRTITSPSAYVILDSKSGNYVFRLGQFVIAHPRLARAQCTVSTEPPARQVRMASRAVRPCSMPVSMTEGADGGVDLCAPGG